MGVGGVRDLPDGFQHADLAKAIKWCRKMDVAIDCGAHRGITVAFLTGKFSRVVAVEPSDLADQITGADVIKAALGAKPGRVSMRDGPHNTGQRYCVPGYDVEVITIDSLRLAPDFIKIDVEGMELDVIKGGRATIAKYRPVVMIEENGLSERYGVARGETGAYLEALGMRLVEVLAENRIGQDWIYAYP